MGEQLPLRCEDNNVRDATSRSSCYEGHRRSRSPAASVSSNCVLFLKRGGTGECEVCGRRKKGNGLEIPCIYRFSGPNKLIKKLKSLLNEIVQ